MSEIHHMVRQLAVFAMVKGVAGTADAYCLIAVGPDLDQPEKDGDNTVGLIIPPDLIDGVIAQLQQAKQQFLYMKNEQGKSDDLTRPFRDFMGG